MRSLVNEAVGGKSSQNPDVLLHPYLRLTRTHTLFGGLASDTASICKLQKIAFADIHLFAVHSKCELFLIRRHICIYRQQIISRRKHIFT